MRAIVDHKLGIGSELLRRGDAVALHDQQHCCSHNKRELPPTLSGFAFTCATLFQEGFQERRGLSPGAGWFAIRSLGRDCGPLFTARDRRTVWVPNPRPVAQDSEMLLDSP
jgi:hypothetical protein